MIKKTNEFLWLVVPCYNEEFRIHLEKFENALLKSPWLYLCFVDDGSKDNTLKILNKLKDNKRVKILSNLKNSGKAETVRTGISFGMQNSECSLFGYWDADLATPLSELEHMYNIISISKEIMLLMGARVKILGKKIERKRIRHYLGRIFATLACVILNATVYDTQCGSKIFTRKFAEICFKEKFNTNWCFDIELLSRLQKHFNNKKCIYNKVIEYPLDTWIDVEGSKIKPSHFYRIGKDLAYLFLINRFKK